MSPAIGVPTAAPAPALAAGDSRTAVLRAAMSRFAATPYSEVTIRMIAADAGVSAPLVMKYFGTKDKLFLAAADLAGHFDGLLDAPDAELARHLVAEVVAIQSWPQAVNPFLATLFIGRTHDAPSGVRERLRTGFIDRLAKRLSGPEDALRAELVCAQLMGLSAMLRSLRTPSLTGADPARIVQLYAPAVEQMLHPDAHSSD